MFDEICILHWLIGKLSWSGHVNLVWLYARALVVLRSTEAKLNLLEILWLLAYNVKLMMTAEFTGLIQVWLWLLRNCSLYCSLYWTESSTFFMKKIYNIFVRSDNEPNQIINIRYCAASGVINVLIYMYLVKHTELAFKCNLNCHKISAKYDYRPNWTINSKVIAAYWEKTSAQNPLVYIKEAKCWSNHFETWKVCRWPHDLRLNTVLNWVFNISITATAWSRNIVCVLLKLDVRILWCKHTFWLTCIYAQNIQLRQTFFNMTYIV